jgi:hypothetical protein
MSIPNPNCYRAFVYLGISEDTFRIYQNELRYLAVWHVIQRIFRIQISGAANTFNANIVARWAG